MLKANVALGFLDRKISSFYLAFNPLTTKATIVALLTDDAC